MQNYVLVGKSKWVTHKRGKSFVQKSTSKRNKGVVKTDKYMSSQACAEISKFKDLVQSWDEAGVWGISSRTRK